MTFVYRHSSGLPFRWSWLLYWDRYHILTIPTRSHQNLLTSFLGGPRSSNAEGDTSFRSPDRGKTSLVRWIALSNISAKSRLTLVWIDRLLSPTLSAASLEIEISSRTLI